MADESLNTRLTVVETTLSQMQAGISDLTKAVRQIADRPQAIPFKEIAATAATCAALFMYAMTAVDSRVDSKTASYQYRVEQLEKKIEKLRDK